eukprot:677770_1
MCLAHYNLPKHALSTSHVVSQTLPICACCRAIQEMVHQYMALSIQSVNQLIIMHSPGRSGSSQKPFHLKFSLVNLSGIMATAQDKVSLLDTITNHEDTTAKESIGDVKVEEMSVTDDMFRSEGSQIQLGSMVWVFRIADVDLVKETFFANFAIEFHWHCTKTDYESYQSDPSNYVPSYIPNFVFMNGEADKIELQTQNDNQGYKIAATGDKGTFGETFGDKLRCPVMNLCYYEISGTFAEKFELKGFPFDVQSLQIQFKSIDDASVAVFVPSMIQFKGDFTGYFLLNHSTLQEYTVHPPFLEYDVLQNFVKQPFINIRLKIERNYMVYMWSIYLLAFVSTASTLFAFALDPVEDLADRLGFVVTLLLTAVAFQFVVTSELPKLPYLTVLDEYIVSSFIFLFGVMFSVAVIPLVGDRFDYEPGDKDHIISKVDFVVFVTALIILIVYHIYTVVQAVTWRKAEVRKIEMDSFHQKQNEEKNVNPLHRINFTFSNSVRISPYLWKNYIDDPKQFHDIKNREY